MPLGKPHPRPRGGCAHRASETPLPARLRGDLMERVSKHKAKSIDRGVRPRPAATQQTVGEGTGPRDTLPAATFLATPYTDSNLWLSGSSPQMEYICPRLAQMCLWHNGKLKERLQFKATGQ